ncbi:MAG TPA: AAA family ATPase [Candidatus Sulfopaludibacter sp.]|jgi:pilus assembly protein CpaE|nr:AAA family ATPase [Candidatus Sulfopaludibacter sp.]
MLDETVTKGRPDPVGNSGFPSHPRLQTNATTVLVCPDPISRNMLTKALDAQHSSIVSTVTAYPNYNAIVALAETECDAILVELDTDSDTALDVVEAICARKPAATVMVYSNRSDAHLVMASMRAGAREFLSGALAPDALSDALLRAAARRIEVGVKRTQGKVMVFWGAKGGSGVTTLATNFAIALRKESGCEVALADMHPQLGEVSVLMGLTPRFTIADALQNPSRLDGDFVQTLVTEHRSGVSVLAAPDSYTLPTAPENRTISKLMELVGSRFQYVVVDAGLGMGHGAEALFRSAGTVYLVTQADIPSLRNCQRLITYLADFAGVTVELVINRYEPRKMEFDEERMNKAIGMAAKWKVPNDYAAARRSANAGTPLESERSPIADVLRQMARAATGKLPEGERKKSFKLFG